MVGQSGMSGNGKAVFVEMNHRGGFQQASVSIDQIARDVEAKIKENAAQSCGQQVPCKRPGLAKAKEAGNGFAGLPLGFLERFAPMRSRRPG